MALVQLDSKISGSKGNTTWAKNKGGAYIRQRSSPTNPNSARQQVVRVELAQSALNWRALTEANRLAWREYALAHPYTNRIGEEKTLSGNAMYNKLNCRVLDIALASLAAPPVYAAPGPLLTFTVVRASATTATLTFTATPLPAGVRLQVWMSTPQNGQVNPNFRQTKLVGYTAAATASGVVITLPIPWAVGQWCTFFAFTMDASGQLSAPLQYKVVGA